jgi:integrase
MSNLYRRGKIWHAEYSVLGVRYRRSTGTRNKSDAQKVVDKWIADAQLTGRGVHRTDASATLTSLLEEYETWLASKSDIHRSKTINRLTRIVTAAGWGKPREITRLSCENAIRSLPNERNGKPLSAASIAHYMTAAKMFTRWLVELRHVLPLDPLRSMSKPSAKNDRKLIRRFLLPEEWTWLKQTPNAILYQTAIETGLRASELRALKQHHLNDGYILLPGNLTKNGNDAKQYISPSLQKALINALPFTGDRWAEMLAADLAQARAAYTSAGGKDRWLLLPVNEAGHVLDFHALRHTTGAWLSIAGVAPKAIQSLMRHSSITLTLDTYGHLMPGDIQQAASVIQKKLHEM